MNYDLAVEQRITDVVRQLQDAGFETYIVGGAIRDLLQEKNPKDYDISTAATPEEVRSVFGRKLVRIIGKRFRLAHLHLGREIIEISTFRRAPDNSKQQLRANSPEHLIVSDNDYGTAEEDARRRDFTINALFYDPVRSELIDHTGMGLDDIRNGVVRAIGDPHLRFEEDPVRMLRALKLVGQFNFAMDDATENALFDSLPLIRHAATSRLSLELEKILSSAYGDKHLQAFHDYGFLGYFLPALEKRWNTPAMEYALDLLTERNYRVDEGALRNSISLAAAILALPFVEEAMGGKPGELWQRRGSVPVIRQVLSELFRPQNMIKGVMASAEAALKLQPVLYGRNPQDLDIAAEYGYTHARELMQIQNFVCWQESDLESFWPAPPSRAKSRKRPPRGKPAPAPAS